MADKTLQSLVGGGSGAILQSEFSFTKQNAQEEMKAGDHVYLIDNGMVPSGVSSKYIHEGTGVWRPSVIPADNRIGDALPAASIYTKSKRLIRAGFYSSSTSAYADSITYLRIAEVDVDTQTDAQLHVVSLGNMTPSELMAGMIVAAEIENDLIMLIIRVALSGSSYAAKTWVYSIDLLTNTVTHTSTNDLYQCHYSNSYAIRIFKTAPDTVFVNYKLQGTIDTYQQPYTIVDEGGGRSFTKGTYFVDDRFMASNPLYESSISSSNNNEMSGETALLSDGNYLYCGIIDLSDSVGGAYSHAVIEPCTNGSGTFTIVDYVDATNKAGNMYNDANMIRIQGDLFACFDTKLNTGTQVAMSLIQYDRTLKTLNIIATHMLDVVFADGERVSKGTPRPDYINKKTLINSLKRIDDKIVVLYSDGRFFPVYVDEVTGTPKNTKCKICITSQFTVGKYWRTGNESNSGSEVYTIHDEQVIDTPELQIMQDIYNSSYLRDSKQYQCITNNGIYTQYTRTGQNDESLIYNTKNIFTNFKDFNSTPKLGVVVEDSIAGQNNVNVALTQLNAQNVMLNTSEHIPINWYRVNDDVIFRQQRSIGFYADRNKVYNLTDNIFSDQSTRYELNGGDSVNALIIPKLTSAELLTIEDDAGGCVGMCFWPQINEPLTGVFNIEVIIDGKLIYLGMSSTLRAVIWDKFTPYKNVNKNVELGFKFDFKKSVKISVMNTHPNYYAKARVGYRVGQSLAELDNEMGGFKWD